MILALKGSNSLSVMKPDHANKWLEAYRKGSRYPKAKMDNFTNLFEKIQSDVMKQFTHSQIFVSTKQINTSINELNELRNKFIHFMPLGWSLNITGLPSLGLDIVEVLKFLVHESGNIYFYEEGHKEHIEQLIEELFCKLTQMKCKYIV
ncbi:hypothetical protein PAT3040_01956 [Paenibacillus agaridevorans]|uniref:Uncharacterized protein n=1 Tax=Paenibacillus agaridevorans TaxID=171404 RepID=A0A2R5EL77_9BACL|nr:hypothetical protein PAT3040_01956 [Paenibacillus agaridevorans]